MDKYKHSRGDLESDFSLSSNKARRLCEVLEGEINEHWTEKKYNKHWYDDFFYSAFQRMVELIRDGYTVPSATQTVINELENEESKRNNGTQSLNNHQDEYKEELIDQLREENKFLKQQLDQKDQRIQQLLPAPDEKEVLKNKSLWQVIREWLKQPATG